MSERDLVRLVALLRQLRIEFGAAFASFDPEMDHQIEINAARASNFMDRLARWERRLMKAKGKHRAPVVG